MEIIFRKLNNFFLCRMQTQSLLANIKITRFIFAATKQKFVNLYSSTKWIWETPVGVCNQKLITQASGTIE